jgi:sulfate adenylyltransferase subunit 2
MREAATQFERPVLLFSGGKDSILMVHIAAKAFAPAKIPFTLVHIDTGHNFPETIDFRDRLVERVGVNLRVGSVQASIDSGRQKEEESPSPSRNRLQILMLLDTLEELQADVALGGDRRDEEKACSKERFFSHRDRFGQWDPKNQRPEVWNIFNGRKNIGEHFRVFPLSNWTEMDVWQYVAAEDIEMPSLYFSHERDVLERDGVLLARSQFNRALDGEAWQRKTIRFRTIGDVTCTGATESTASTLEHMADSTGRRNTAGLS